MASFFHKVMCRSVGEAWRYALQVWAENVVDDTNTIYGTQSTDSGCRCIEMGVTIGDDTHYYFLLVNEVPDDSVKVPLAYVLSSPGWRSMPPVMLATYGTRSTHDNYNLVMRSIRNGVLNFWCGNGTPDWGEEDITPTGWTGMHVYKYQARLRYKGFLAADSMVLVTRTSTPPFTFLADAVPMDGISAGPSTPLGAGGSTDLSGVVQAIQDGNHKTTMLGINNGGALYAVESSEILDPP